MCAERAEKPRAALLTHLCGVVGMPVALPRRFSRGNYTYARADILSRAILVYELDCYTVKELVYEFQRYLRLKLIQPSFQIVIFRERERLYVYYR